MIGHLGARVSDLLDGRLSPAEEERAWEHVHLCHLCRDGVEREGWVKTQLAGLSSGLSAVPEGLKGALLGAPSLPDPAHSYLVVADRGRSRAAAWSGSAAGVAVLGLLTLGAAPASAPVMERRPPVTSLVRPSAPTGVGVSLRESGTSKPARPAHRGAASVTMPW